MKKILLVLSLAFFIVFPFSLDSYALPNEIEVEILSPLYADDYEKTNMYGLFDFVFIAKIEEFMYSSYAGMEQAGIPNSYFKVTDTQNLKGELRPEEIIKFVGGFNPAGKLVLLDDMSYPEESKHYLFFANEPSYDKKGGHEPGSFVIFHPEMMIPLEGYIEGFDIQYQNDAILDLITSYTWEDSYNMSGGFEFVGGDGGSAPTNNTIFSAINITANTTYIVDIPHGESRFFKFVHSGNDSLSFYSFQSSQGFNPIASILNANNQPLLYGSNHLVSNAFLGANHGLTKTTDPNFFISMYIRKNQSYFIEIRGHASTPQGQTRFKYEVDNVMLGSYQSLILSNHSVGNDKKMYYKSTSKYASAVTGAVSMWNELEHVSIILQTGGFFSRTDLTFRDYSNSTSGQILATYNPVTNLISFNTFYLDNSYFNNSHFSVALHELGHALGLGHSPRGNIMYYALTYQNHFGPTDISVYRRRWS